MKKRQQRQEALLIPCGVQVSEAEKEGAVQRVVAQGWQREVALLEPQVHRLQAQLDAHQHQVLRHSQKTAQGPAMGAVPGSELVEHFATLSNF